MKFDYEDNGTFGVLKLSGELQDYDLYFLRKIILSCIQTTARTYIDTDALSLISEECFNVLLNFSQQYNVKGREIIFTGKYAQDILVASNNLQTQRGV